jgi:bacteriocin biosynthesis docking scaffold, SagD family
MKLQGDRPAASTAVDPPAGGLALRLRPRYRAVGLPGQGVFLLSERDDQILEGNIFVDLMPYLEAGTSEEVIADSLEDSYARATIHYALRVMDARGLLTRTPTSGDDEADRFWDEAGVDPALARTSLAEATVGLVCVGSIDLEPVAAAIASLGPRVDVGRLAGASLSIVLVDDYRAVELEHIANEARRSGQPLLLVRPHGTEVWIGPLIRADGACYHCLAFRIDTNNAIVPYLSRQLPSATNLRAARARIGAHAPLVAGLVAAEVARWASGLSEVDATVRSVDLRTLDIADHVLRRRPQCRACGDPHMQSGIQSRPIVLDTQDLRYDLNLDDVLPFLSPITGIVTGLVRAETVDRSLHSYTAYFGFGREAGDLASLKNAALSQAAGVGETAESAKLGAMCEAIERYSGMWHGDEPTIQATLASLESNTVVDPRSYLQYSPGQYARRDEINARQTTFDLVPRPFDDAAVMDWTGMWSLTAKRFKLLPSAALFYGSPQPPGGPYCWADSNGCAAGATLADAIRRGLLELIERDAVAIWWYNRLRRPGVDLSSFQDADFDQFVETYRALGREVWVLDLTTDLEVPSYVAVSRSLTTPTEDILVSFGADLEARRAIAHALLEMNHLVPAVLPQNRGPAGEYPYPDPSQQRWWRTATVENEPYLLPDPDRPQLGTSDLQASASTDLDATGVLLQRLEARGLEILALDQTRPDIGIPVAKVIVPGLRHFWPRFAPGRLYDVPVALGWRPEPCRENDLNPISMFV